MKKIKTDICIVGTGFSGTFIANTLQGTSARILMVDKGAYLSRERVEENFILKNSSSLFDRLKKLYKLSEGIYDDPEFRHYEHVNSGKDVFSYSGRHAIGGTSLVWFGNAIRKIPNDFRTRSTYGFGEDWPISYNDLEEYYYQAEVEMGFQDRLRISFHPIEKNPFLFLPFSFLPVPSSLIVFLKDLVLR